MTRAGETEGWGNCVSLTPNAGELAALILHHAGCKLARLVIGRDGLKQSRVMPMQQVSVHASML